jgi:regulatory protein
VTPRRRAPQAPAGPLDLAGARRAAFDLLSRKAWTRRDLLGRLRRRRAPADVAATVVAELETRGYLDDESFARWWAEARAKGRRVGSARLRQELRAKGIPNDLAAAAVAAAFEEVPELDRALEAGRRRLAALTRGAPERVPARLADYLLRRGYPPPVAARVVKRLLAHDANADAAAADLVENRGV